MKNKALSTLFLVILLLILVAWLCDDGDNGVRLTPDVPCCADEHTPVPPPDYQPWPTPTGD